jgi:heparanase
MRHGSKILTVLSCCALATGCTTASQPPHPLAALTATGTVSERYQSYNVEMVEITGGRFWAPYSSSSNDTYRMRPPEDLADQRLRALARHLGPAWVRVSGTWANTTYLPAAEENITAPPAGYNQVLQRSQWRGLVDFARAVDARILTSFAVSPGTRGADGAWRTDQADRLLALTQEAGGRIDAAEFFNEPNAAAFGGLPRGYSEADYGRDFRIFRDWARRSAPSMLIVGPSSVGEGAFDSADGPPVAALNAGALTTRGIMSANPNSVGTVSYHFYGNVSQRCEALLRRPGAQRSAALSPAWLDLTLRDHAFYTRLRDQFEPGDPIWITETAQAACGGSPWAAAYVDSFRYVNQLGLLAQRGVQVIFHNTLTASDCSSISE